jgi:L-alanine-DL-glutamate epimerase-like enolase superfamily enzyme
MKITRIRNYVSMDYHVHLVRVDTDEGVSGYGECSPMSPTVTAEIVREHLAPKVIGRDPFAVERIEHDCMLHNYKISGQLLAMAFSGIELALRDIAGKYLKQPVYNLLGGKFRDSVEFYASSMSRDLTVAQEAEKLAEAVRDYGVKAVKIKLGRRMGHTGDKPDFAYEESKTAAIRNAIGPSVKLMVDCNGSFTYAETLQLWERIRGYDIFHLEEPCPYYDVNAYRMLAAALPVPIHVGEQDWNLMTFRDYIATGACHICAADLTKSGGFINSKRIAALCKAYNVTFGPHCTSRGIGFAASMQLAACTPEYTYYQECSIEKTPNQSFFLSAPPVIRDGKYQIPDAPGMGLELDMEKLESICEVVE